MSPCLNQYQLGAATGYLNEYNCFAWYFTTPYFLLSLDIIWDVLMVYCCFITIGITIEFVMFKGEYLQWAKKTESKFNILQ